MSAARESGVLAALAIGAAVLALLGCGGEPVDAPGSREEAAREATTAPATPAEAPPDQARPDEAPSPDVNASACARDGEGVRVEVDRLVVEGPLGWNLYEGTIDEASCGPALDALARRLLACPDIGLEIQVHTDAMRMGAFNARSSQTIAEALRARLARSGVPVERLAACGYGESRPIADNQTEAGRAANNRAEWRRVTGPASAHVCPAVE